MKKKNHGWEGVGGSYEGREENIRAEGQSPKRSWSEGPIGPFQVGLALALDRQLSGGWNLSNFPETAAFSSGTKAIWTR